MPGGVQMCRGQQRQGRRDACRGSTAGTLGGHMRQRRGPVSTCFVCGNCELQLHGHPPPTPCGPKHARPPVARRPLRSPRRPCTAHVHAGTSANVSSVHSRRASPHSAAARTRRSASTHGAQPRPVPQCALFTRTAKGVHPSSQCPSASDHTDTEPAGNRAAPFSHARGLVHVRARPAPK